ncbi:MAG: aspartate kinase [Elusimicrobiota bacterium]
MALIVMKFGGSSVADTVKVKHVASRVIEVQKRGNKVVVVVSAPGDMTDDLIAKAKEITENPSDREMDMLLATGEQVSIALLAMAIRELGQESISLTGPQAGIYADRTHTKARITRIIPTKIYKELQKNKIVIVAGFQGQNPNRDITTLGRGGSDLTAVALAAALKADECEIFTDVKGVYTTDPRVVPDARKIDAISYDEMLEMAGSGAQVMQARSIEVAKKYNVVLHIRSTFSTEKGTIVRREVNNMEEVVVSSVAFDKDQAKLSITDLPDKPGVAAKIFSELGKANIMVDMIIQSAAQDRSNDISFTVSKHDLDKVLPILAKLKKEIGAKDVLCDKDVAKVSIVGVGMRSHAGVAAKMFSALAKEKINIEMISTSEIKISCMVDSADIIHAVRVLHEAFGLAKRQG